ncbi:MAG: YfdX family protein [Methylomonas sp.]
MKLDLKTFPALTLATGLLMAGNASAELKELIVQPRSTIAEHAAAHKQQARAISKEKQTKLVKEGIDAVIATEQALNDLEHNNPKDALAKLNVASAKLSTLQTKGYTANLIPVSFQEQSIVFEGGLDDVKHLSHQATDLIDDHRLQEAKQILDELTSEIRINVIELPLSEYPAAIEKAKTQLGNHQENEAKKTLADILDSLVAHFEIYPLPILAAEADLTDAFELEHKTDWSKPEQKTEILALVDKAEKQIELAEALGYGEKKDFESLNEGITALRETLHTNKFKESWEKVKTALGQLKAKFQFAKK